MTTFAEGAEDGHELAPRRLTQEGERIIAHIKAEQAKVFHPVNRPSHYASGGIECADAIEAALHGETDATVGWCRGNAIKYLWRSGKKDDTVQDLRKAIWYIERAIQRIQKREGRADA